MKPFFFSAILVSTVFSTYTFSQDPTPSPSPESSPRVQPNASFVLTQKDTASVVSSDRAISSAGVINGKAVRLVTPPYPLDARAVRASGAVNVQVVLDEQGNVVSATAISGHPLLQPAAEKAARASKFSPTLLEGKAVRVSGIIVYNFIADAAPRPMGTFTIGNAALNPKIAQTNWIRWSMLLTYIDRSQDAAVDTMSLSLAGALPNELVSEKELLKQIPAAPQNHAKIISDIYNLLQTKIKGSDAWQIEMGKSLTELNYQVGTTIFDESFSFDPPIVRQNLLKVRELCKNPPSDFPVDLSQPLGKLAALAENNNPDNAENLIAMMRNLQKIFRQVSIAELK